MSAYYCCPSDCLSCVILCIYGVSLCLCADQHRSHLPIIKLSVIWCVRNWSCKALQTIQRLAHDWQSDPGTSLTMLMTISTVFKNDICQDRVNKNCYQCISFSDNHVFGFDLFWFYSFLNIVSLLCSIFWNVWNELSIHLWCFSKMHNRLFENFLKV